MSATSRRVGDLINEIEEGRLKLRPPFQRRLVWTNVVKDNFLETVHLGLPFPEIFIATGEIDTKSRKRTNWLVDGQQRISTLREYVVGSPDLTLKKVKPYAQLSEGEKTTFLDYEVVVRDLGTATKEQIIDIFQRINSTDYALKHIERLNAMFTGQYNKFCDDLSRDAFFDRHEVFSLTDRRRMLDLDFCVILVTTLLSTYYHRSDLNKEYLERYNDDFPDADSVRERISTAVKFIEECRFDESSRAWRKTDLLTLVVEIDSALNARRLSLDPEKVGPGLTQFYLEVEALYATTGGKDGAVSKLDAEVFRYLKAATKATNDRYARVDRAEVLSKIIALSSGVSSPKKRPSKRPRMAKRS